MPKHAKSIEVIARGVFIGSSQLLICQNLQHLHCFLPGGHVDPGEAAKEALAREMIEEMGVHFNVGVLLGVCESSFEQPSHKTGKLKKHHELNLVFAMDNPRHADGQPVEREQLAVSLEEHITFAWMNLTSLGNKQGEAAKATSNDASSIPGSLLPAAIGDIVLSDPRARTSLSSDDHTIPSWTTDMI